MMRFFTSIKSTLASICPRRHSVFPIACTNTVVSKSKSAVQINKGRTFAMELKFKPPTARPNIQKVPTDSFKSIVIVDLETNGQEFPESEIIEVAACDAYSDADGFHVYVNPEADQINYYASNLTHLTKVNGIMMKNLLPVESEPVEAALENFVKYLEGKPKPVMLVAHKAIFDLKFLTQNLSECNLLQRFMDCVVGFADTLDAARKKIPKSETLQNYTLTALFCHLTDAPAEGPHEASNDVIALKTILPRVMPTNQDVSDFSYDLAEFVNFRSNCIAAKDMLDLLNVKGVSQLTLFNLAKCGVQMKTLLSKSAAGEDILSAWLTDKATPLIKPAAVARIVEFLNTYVPSSDERD